MMLAFFFSSSYSFEAGSFLVKPFFFNLKKLHIYKNVCSFSMAYFFCVFMVSFYEIFNAESNSGFCFS